MINLRPVPAFTVEQYKATANYGGEKAMFYFMQNTRHFYEVCEDDTVVGLLGLVPRTALSKNALAWFGPIKGATFTRKQLREGKQLSEVFFRKQPYSIYAEVDMRKKATVKFVEFFGMEKQETLGNIALYARMK